MWFRCSIAGIVLFFVVALGGNLASAEDAATTSDQLFKIALIGRIEDPVVEEVVRQEYQKYFALGFDPTLSQSFARFIGVFIGDEFVKNGQFVLTDAVNWNQSQTDIFKELGANRAFPEDGCQHRRVYFSTGEFGVLLVDASENPDLNVIRKCFVVGMLASVWTEPSKLLIGDFEVARYELEKRVAAARIQTE